jgi:hypothetical protein
VNFEKKLLFRKFRLFSKVSLNNFLCLYRSFSTNIPFYRSRRDLQESLKYVRRLSRVDPLLTLKNFKNRTFRPPSYRHNAASATMTRFDVHIELFEIYRMVYRVFLNFEYFHDLTLNQS